MTYIVVDVESDGPYPPKYSMVCFGAVLVNDALDKTFYGRTNPISLNWNPDALAISGFTREAHLCFPTPEKTMEDFAYWIKKVSHDSKPTFISDNPAFDFAWINHYFHEYYGNNPFGFSARRIGDIYCGLVGHMGKNSEWKKKYRKTKHTHNPVDDAMGNAEALLAFRDELGLKAPF